MADEKTKSVVEEEDDFTFGDLKTGKDKPEEKQEEKTTEDDDEGKIPEEKKEEEKKVEPKKEEVKKVDDKKTTEGKEGKTDEQEEEEEEEADIFLDKTDSAAEGTKLSLKKLAKDLDVDLEKDDDPDEFKTKFSEKLEKSKSEFKLDGYSDDAKAVIKHLNENGGDLDSFFVNKQIAAMQSVLALDPETKFRNVRVSELMAEGKTKAEAAETVEAEVKELSTREIKDYADDIDSQAKRLINDEVKKIVGDKEIKAAAERARREAEAVAERGRLKSFIEKQDNFLGLGLTPEAKKLILRDIDNGTFDKVLNQNQEQIKFSSYMFSKYGSKIMKKIETSLSEQNRKGYNAATRKALDALHKTDEGKGTQRKSGHEPEKKATDTGSKPKWDDKDFEGE